MGISVFVFVTVGIKNNKNSMMRLNKDGQK